MADGFRQATFSVYWNGRQQFFLSAVDTAIRLLF